MKFDVVSFEPLRWEPKNWIIWKILLLGRKLMSSIASFHFSSTLNHSMLELSCYIVYASDVQPCACEGVKISHICWGMNYRLIYTVLDNSHFTVVIVGLLGQERTTSCSCSSLQAKQVDRRNHRFHSTNEPRVSKTRINMPTLFINLKQPLYLWDRRKVLRTLYSSQTLLNKLLLHFYQQPLYLWSRRKVLVHLTLLKPYWICCCCFISINVFSILFFFFW